MRKGMTLMEMLVVLVIIALLVALVAWRTGAVYLDARAESEAAMTSLINEAKWRAEADGQRPRSVNDLIRDGYLPQGIAKDAEHYQFLFEGEKKEAVGDG